jgi:alpha-tubulin suppressor-like RCC1 family protein
MKSLGASAGTNTTCATSQSGKVWCWGKGHFGQAGRLPSLVGPAGCQYCTPTPAAVVDVDGGALANAEVAVASGATCVRRADMTIWCFGINGFGELGQGTVDLLSGDSSHYVPEKVPVLPAAANVAARFAQVFATDTVGDGWIWGENRYGTLGDGTTAGVACANGVLACVTTPKKNASLTGMVQISPGASAVVARKADGTVWTWGANTQGQLGHAPKSAGDIALCNDDLPCNPSPSKVTVP